MSSPNISILYLEGRVGIMEIKQGGKIYEGKAKILYATNDKDLVIQHFKDEATAFDGTKKGIIQDKGVCNNKISSTLFAMLKKKGIPSHFVKQLNDRDMLIKKLSIVKVEVIVRNVAAGSLAKRLGLPEGTPMKRTVLEYCYKNDALHDPQINIHHVLAIGLATEKQMQTIDTLSFKINNVLKPFFKKRGLNLIDFKLEFGVYKGKILLGDEISPDTCRFWDSKTNEKLDKDRFRRDLGNVEEAYQEILKRVTTSP
jgi:phosphoribosylaminoimidazole-succinocarboxamide synthase